MRIGLFGGSFDPIHRGHLRTCQAILRAFEMDEVRLIPSAVPPHKTTVVLAPFEHRMAMVQTAIVKIPGLVASDIEGHRIGPSYTIDTVRQSRAGALADTEFFFILGLDAFLEIDLWKSFQELLGTISLLVAGRPGAGAGMEALSSQAADFAAQRISTRYRLAKAGDRLDHPDRPSIHLFVGPAVAISSTRVRKRLAQGRSVEDLVPSEVANYIDQKELYQ